MASSMQGKQASFLTTPFLFCPSGARWIQGRELGNVGAMGNRTSRMCPTHPEHILSVSFVKPIHRSIFYPSCFLPLSRTPRPRQVYFFTLHGICIATRRGKCTRGMQWLPYSKKELACVWGRGEGGRVEGI